MEVRTAKKSTRPTITPAMQPVFCNTYTPRAQHTVHSPGELLALRVPVRPWTPRPYSGSTSSQRPSVLPGSYLQYVWQKPRQSSPANSQHTNTEGSRERQVYDEHTLHVSCHLLLKQTSLYSSSRVDICNALRTSSNSPPSRCAAVLTPRSPARSVRPSF
eukprot:scaffold2658_cov390-Prasinococcus_capsulatus_cf.AAC.1